ncbi:MAG: lipopolysaccharide kinase InaA family protein, partial [Conexivisphaera sp.]
SRLLSIPEGMLSSEGLNPLLEGCGGARSRPLGEFYSTTRVVEASCGGRGIRIVVKDYGSPWSAKWIMVRVAAAGIREMRLTSLERLSAEYAFTRSLRAVGLSTPRILLVDPGRPLMAREYVEGVVLEKAVGEEEPFRELGRLMGRLHSIGVTLGDVKPSNFLISQPGAARIYLIDCEQAMLGGSAPWDVASFLYFLAPLGRRRGWDAVRKSATSFLDGYSSTGSVEDLEAAASARYLAPLSPLLQPGEAAAMAGALSRFLSSRRAAR